jgi:hypothetical protein
MATFAGSATTVRAPRKSPKATTPDPLSRDPLRDVLVDALNIDVIPTEPPTFPGLPQKTDFRQLASYLNLRVLRPVDKFSEDADMRPASPNDADELLIPGHYTRFQTDHQIARWAAAKALDAMIRTPRLQDILGLGDREEQIERLAAALFIDKAELAHFAEANGDTSADSPLVDTLSSLFAAPSNYISLRLNE